ncbi:exonuclease 1 isoform X2 [Cryptomeria japonica]|uniref:exonuclease 1 isoform X2 n=1 Tax=Cryptomeria japonica TaxID=3369 RepID=UPI0027DA5DA9|nr:exonuclease 1 isoform X2 [Cryptomeria japonica]
MGIKDLFKVMKPYIDRVHVNKYAGKRVGIDAYSWLHKGAYSCSMEICQRAPNTKSSNLPYMKYFMERISMLRYYNVIPVVVFDGGRLPSKAATEQERQRKRDANLEQARTKLSQGDFTGAIEFFQGAIKITPFMAHELIHILKEECVEYMVAPYEADSQLAYLSMLDPEKGGLAAVISEDSDLLAYGCNVVIYKMDKFGVGEEVILDRAFDCTNVSAGKFTFKCFTQELFTGCDYLSSITGIGIKRSHSLVSQYKNLDQVLSALRLKKKGQIPEGYINSFKETLAVFRHARVYDPNLRRLSFLRPVQEGFLEAFEGNLDFLGPELSPLVVIAIAEGRIDPLSMEYFDKFPQVTSQEHGILFTNQRVTLQNQSRGLQSESDSSPFVLISQNEKDTISIRTGEKISQKLSHTTYKNQGKQSFNYWRAGIPLPVKVNVTISHNFALSSRGMLTGF